FSTDTKRGFKFLGIIENVREIEVDDPSTGTPKLEILITGKSFAKVFDTNIFFNPVVNQAAIQTVLGASFLNDSSKSLKPLSQNSPDKVIKRLIKFYLGSQLAALSAANENWYVPPRLAQFIKGPEKNKAIGKS